MSNPSVPQRKPDRTDREEVKQMQAVIAYGEPKEIAALVAAIQERREMPCEAQRVYGVGQNRSIENEDGTMTLR